MAGTSVGEQVLARELWPRVESDWLLIADRNFLGWADWHAASAGGAQLLWRAKSSQRLPVLEVLADGSYRSIMFSSTTHNQGVRARLTDAARRGEPLDPERAIAVRVVEYTVDDRVHAYRDGPEIFRLVTTITDPAAAP